MEKVTTGHVTSIVEIDDGLGGTAYLVTCVKGCDLGDSRRHSSRIHAEERGRFHERLKEGQP